MLEPSLVCRFAKSKKNVGVVCCVVKGLPESSAKDFGGGTGWKTTGKMAPGSWLSTCSQYKDTRKWDFVITKMKTRSLG